MLIERQMIERAKQKVLTSAAWFTQIELAKLAGMSSDEMQFQLAVWKSS